MSINRRNFLGKLAKTTALASAFAVGGYGMTKITNDPESEEKRDFEDVTEDQFREILKLMTTYEIDSSEALALHDAMKEERSRLISTLAAYSAVGAFTGSAMRTATLEAQVSKALDHPEKRKDSIAQKFVDSVQRLTIPTGAAELISYPINSLVEPLEKSRLIDIKILQNEFGLSQKNAEKFSEDLKTTYRGQITDAGAGTAIFVELWGDGVVEKLSKRAAENNSNTLEA